MVSRHAGRSLLQWRTRRAEVTSEAFGSVTCVRSPARPESLPLISSQPGLASNSHVAEPPQPRLSSLSVEASTLVRRWKAGAPSRLAWISAATVSGALEATMEMRLGTRRIHFRW